MKAIVLCAHKHFRLPLGQIQQHRNLLSLYQEVSSKTLWYLTYRNRFNGHIVISLISYANLSFKLHVKFCLKLLVESRVYDCIPLNLINIFTSTVSMTHCRSAKLFTNHYTQGAQEKYPSLQSISTWRCKLPS